MSTGFRTVTSRGSASFERRGSQFIGYIAPARSREAAEAVIAELARAHSDATHVVSAYRLYDEPPQQQCDDDGEPGGSAGKPALHVLQAEELLDVVAVVVRYYGGTKLGFGGLVRAYGHAVSVALDTVEVVEREPTTERIVTVDYDNSGTVRSILESEGVEFTATYEQAVSFVIELPARDEEAVLERIRSATSATASIE